MILGKAKLIERLGRRADDKKSLVITPLLSPVDSICADAIDLRLGTNFILCRSDRLAANVPKHACRQLSGIAERRSHGLVAL